MAMFVSIGTLTSHLLWFPAGVAKAFPVQHAINVIAGVTLGPIPALLVAFAIGLLRNLFGVGSLLAFPGGMIGALLAGYFYKRFKMYGAAAAGEWIGTGMIGALLTVPVATFFLGSKTGAFFFVLPFLTSSVAGGIIGLVILRLITKNTYVKLRAVPPGKSA
ncbi:energy coupling factor transporter S component ThiW [Fictibacillus phosphorivorans]|uniref:energy coupling factor transporter S component ThiW n=1 Tax=Fictibacillus phosphorivorans TaxID=1221500 RepID=UPI002040C62D|nr:energy coupling factor transporter S component ThiW [Fictibacillus phosphorivorans]MCM3719277.1 energy coupling factor transporter S component ThiW [Fictibacillus phosphorivorans]MCM3776899.1 energy coupling factor transporter S component ThiW [Fictibacillus phosphorivorans]